MRALPIALAAAAGISATPAAAQTLKPLIDARLRWESVDQDGFARDADAVTVRVRAGVEAKAGDFAALVEAEGTLALVERYNSSVNGLTGYPTIADPENVELNRAQLQYRGLPKTVITAGRQRIALDDQRFVGNVGWRQNEQSFDAVRVESGALGPVAVDVTYAWSDRTIYGVDSPIASIGGDNVFAGASVKLGPVAAKGFAYLVDQDAPGRRQYSSQTYGVRATGAFPLAKATKLALAASFARQSDWQGNPADYAASYWLGEAQLQWKRLGLTGGYEVLGSDGGAAGTSFQTPLATLHKFQGWADKFLTTPADGVRDLYLGGAYALPAGKSPLTFNVVWHRFTSDRLVRPYGSEWDLQLGFKPARQLAATIKFASYQADGFATDTRKLWLQLDYAL